MICPACRERRHGECRGGSWCDCQHLPPAEPATSRERTPPSGDRTSEDDGAEPDVNWLRQG
ncbi:hypothetical protein NE236_32110 [Actinoallomurus purpureus]|uniref:hypothetical protein n=1 Tax=Actinoallomurus purpureus TaxID=478114 RepID=UPI002092AA92|nr:hypothetical protein [Actinoallomurus purpureus]MCO6009627.1 hypothetical protein [Actinoallomurus purpureus]